LESKRTANPVQTTAIYGVRRGLSLSYGSTDHRGKVRAVKEMPNVPERYVFGDPAGNHATRTRTTEVAAEISKTGDA